jgi:hypothetical protein
MAEPLEFLNILKPFAVTALYLFGIFAITFFSVSVAQILVFIHAIVQGIKHRNVLILIRKIFKNTLLNASFHTVLAAALIFLIFTNIPWWWLPMIVMVLTYLFYVLFKKLAVMYLNATSRKFFRYFRYILQSIQLMRKIYLMSGR